MNTPFNSNSSNPSERAKALLAYYLQLATAKNFTTDNYSEIGQIIDDILQAHKEQSLEFRLQRLERQNAYLLENSKNNLKFLLKTQKVLEENIRFLPAAEKKELSQLLDELNDWLLEE